MILHICILQYTGLHLSVWNAGPCELCSPVSSRARPLSTCCGDQTTQSMDILAFHSLQLWSGGCLDRLTTQTYSGCKTLLLVVQGQSLEAAIPLGQEVEMAVDVQTTAVLQTATLSQRTTSDDCSQTLELCFSFVTSVVALPLVCKHQPQDSQYLILKHLLCVQYVNIIYILIKSYINLLFLLFFSFFSLSLFTARQWSWTEHLLKSPRHRAFVLYSLVVCKT